MSDFSRVYKKYGAEAIGSVLGVPAATVRRWAGKGKSAGLPKSREAAIAALETIRQHEGYEEKALREMMRLARFEGELKSVKEYNKRREAEHTTGQESSKRFSGFLDERMLLEIRHHLETVPLARALPNWLASVQMSVFGEPQHTSNVTMLQVDHPEADDFVLSAIQSSGLYHSRQAAINSVIGKLRGKLNTDSKYYIHGVNFSTYQYKSEAETKELRSRRRRERK